MVMAEIWQWLEVFLPWVVLVVCSIVGLVGTLLPAVPGGALILLGAWIFAFWTGFQRMAVGQEWLLGWPTLTLVTMLALIGGIGQYVVSGLGAKQFGASKWGVAGALVGFVVGLLFTPVGSLIGAFVGAALVEYLLHVRRRNRAGGEEVPAEEGVEPAEAPTPDPVDGEPEAGRWDRVKRVARREGRDAGKATLAGVGAVFGAAASFVFEFVFGLLMVLVIVVGLIV